MEKTMENFEIQTEMAPETTISERAKHYEQEIARYAEYLKETFNDDLNALMQEEQRIIALQDAHNQMIADHKGFDLLESVEFDGENFSRKVIGTRIKNLLGKKELSVEFTLGYYEVYKFWDNPKAKISFNLLDATLKMLRDEKYCGVKEWQTALLIDKFFEPIKTTEYQRFVLDNLLYAHMHNAVISQMQMHQVAE